MREWQKIAAARKMAEIGALTSQMQDKWKSDAEDRFVKDFHKAVEERIRTENVAAAEEQIMQVGGSSTLVRTRSTLDFGTAGSRT